jgi:hypothetical protein
MVMRNLIRPALLAGAAAAQSPTSHVVTIALPGGGIKEIQYTGNCAAAQGAQPGSIGVPTAPAPAYGPRMMEASAPGAQPYAGLVRPIPTNWER